jgi:HlyD family secretion protein
VKTALLAVASLAGLGVWYSDTLLVRSGVTWVRNELKVSEGNATSPQYITARVEEGQIRRTVTATGSLNAIVNVEIGSQLSGQIARVLVDFNDEVKKGQPLALLDQRSFQARVDEAQAALDLAQNNIGITKAKLETIRIDLLENIEQRAVHKARVDNVSVVLDGAQAELRRKQALRAEGSTSIAVLEDASRRKASAEIALREAEATTAAHEQKIAGTTSEVRRVEAELEGAVDNVKQKEALLRLAQIDFDRTTIRSPINGAIVGRNVNEGQTVATDLEAKTLFIVAGDLQQMQIEAKVDEADISMLQVGQGAIFTVDAYPGRQFTATVQQIRKAPEVQQNVVTYTVVLSAANAHMLLLPGMTALVHVTVNQTGRVLKVPLAALRFRPHAAPQTPESNDGKKSQAVWVVSDDGEPKSLSIGLGEEDSSDVAVVSGALAKGDLVIIGEAQNSRPRELFGIRIGL